MIFAFPARYEVVVHDRIPRAPGLPVWVLPGRTHPDAQQELATAPVLEVRPASGDRWVGIFGAEEAPDVGGIVIGWPDEKSLCLFGVAAPTSLTRRTPVA